MTLNNRSTATKGPYRKHDFPERIPEDEIPSVLEKVKEDDTEAKERMILGHGRLAISIVNRYIRAYNLYRYVEDLDGAALCGVVFAVDRIANGHLKHDNPTGYIVTWIHDYVTKCVRGSSVVYTPKWKGEISNAETLPDNLSTKENMDYVEFNDLMESLTDDANEKRILELRYQGYTDTEISELLEMSYSRVARTRNDLLKRFLKKKEERNVAPY